VTVDPQKRITISEVVEKAWFGQGNGGNSRPPTAESAREDTPIFEMEPVLGPALSKESRMSRESRQSRESRKSGSSVEPVPPVTPITQPVKLTIVSAKGLRKADWFGLSDPYCTVRIQQRPEQKYRTPVHAKTLDPVWNHEVEFTDYVVGDSLEFTVWDKDLLKPNDLLGKATLANQQFHPAGFEGDLPLSDAGNGIKASLRVRIAAAPSAKTNAGAIVKRVIWEFGVRERFRKLQAECQASIEAQYQAFRAGEGPAEGSAVLLGRSLKINFEDMSSAVEGNAQKTQVRRLYA